MQSLQDGGGVYVIGDATNRLITGCYTYTTHSNLYARHYYLDQATTGTTVSGNVALGLLQWAVINVLSVNNTVTNNYWNTGADINNDYDPSNVVSGNVNSISGSTAQAIIAAAGKS